MTSRTLVAMAKLGLAALGSAAFILTAMPGVAQAQIRLDRPVGGGQQQPAAPAAPAAGGVLSTVTVTQLVQILSGAGYTKGQVVDTKNNAIRAAKFDLNGTPVVVLLMNCSGENCSTFAFLTYFGKQSVTSEYINAYNYQKSFGKLALDKDGDLVLSMEGFYAGGVAPSWIATSGQLFGGVLKGLLEFKP